MKRTLLFIITCFAYFVVANAQSACDKLYAKAVECQKIMTVESQNVAIKNFEKAKNCYDSKEKKQLCQAGIAACRNTISLLKKTKPIPSPVPGPKPIPEDSVAPVPSANNNVGLSASETILKFKSKGGEFLKIKINCKYNDWKVVNKPDWISYSISTDNEIICEATKNLEKKERQGMIVIECRNTQISVAVMQAKKGIIEKILSK